MPEMVPTLAPPPVALLDVPAAAHFLRLSPRSLGSPEFRARHGVPFYRIGARILFDVAELRTWLAEHRQEARGG